VQAVIADPERLRRRPEGHFYALSTRARCGLCGSATVGQTLTVKGQPYRYYRCRHVYDANTSRQCAARYVRGPELEGAVWREVRRVLTDPGIVLRELRYQADELEDSDETARLEAEIGKLQERVSMAK
jgi:site-specific DNA recombinase